MPGLQDIAWFRLPAGCSTDIEGAADAFYVIGLIIAMGTDRTLELSTPVSERLLYNSGPIQSILANWYPKKLAKVAITVASRAYDAQSLRSPAITCFTGGVDSFYSLVTNQETIGSLLYVHGFDIPLSREDLREEKSAHLRDIAKTADKELIEISTNIRKFLNPAVEWGHIGHGSALASIGHLVSGRTGRLLIPASHTYADIYPWGSHPLLDHLWSSDRLSVVHDGAEANRVEKTRAIALDPSAQKHLQVCWQKTGKYNCGKCEKCLRTKIALKLTGALSDFETFDSELSLDEIRRMKIRNASDLSFVLENLAFAEKQGNVELAGALQYVSETFGSQKKADVTEPYVTALEKRVERLEAAHAATDTRLLRLQNFWPVRAWAKFAEWRHR